MAERTKPEPDSPISPEAPGTVIQAPNATHWVHETPGQIKEKIAEVKLGASEDEDGLLHLVGLDLFPGDPIEIVPFELALEPSFIINYRGVTERFWQIHCQMAARGGRSG